MWVIPDENQPVKFKRNRSASKQLIARFFVKFGHVATIPFEDRKTVTAEWYVNHCFLKSSRHDVNDDPDRVSVAYCSIKTMPART